MTMSRAKYNESFKQPLRGEMLTVTQVAKKIGMKKTWIYNLMKTGKLPFPFFLHPGKKLFDSADIDDWLRSIKVPSRVKTQEI